MKRFLYLMLMLPLLGLIATSCDDDKKDTIDVSVSLDYSNATEVDGVLYVVEGENLVVDKIIVTPAPGTKTAEAVSACYYINTVPVTPLNTVTTDVTIPTSSLSVGSYTFNIQVNVFQVDKEPGVVIMNIPFKIVASASDIPSGGATTGTISSK